MAPRWCTRHRTASSCWSSTRTTRANSFPAAPVCMRARSLGRRRGRDRRGARRGARGRFGRRRSRDARSVVPSGRRRPRPLVVAGRRAAGLHGDRAGGSGTAEGAVHRGPRRLGSYEDRRRHSERYRPMGAVVVARRIADRLHRFERVGGRSGMEAQRHGRRPGRNEPNGADGCGTLLLFGCSPGLDWSPMVPGSRSSSQASNPIQTVCTRWMPTARVSRWWRDTSPYTGHPLGVPPADRPPLSSRARRQRSVRESAELAARAVECRFRWKTTLVDVLSESARRG